MLIVLLSCGLTACGTTESIHAQANEPANLSESDSEVTYAESFVEQVPAQRTPVDYTIYESFGLQYDKAKNELQFEGELIRYFYDGGNLYDEMGSVYCEYLNEKGTVDVYATRKPTDNGDGSVDPFGELTGIERYSQEEFVKRDLSKFYDFSEEVTSASGIMILLQRPLQNVLGHIRSLGLNMPKHRMPAELVMFTIMGNL